MQEFIERKGFDPIAEKLGIEPKGWLYGIIINGFQSPEGKARLEKMLIDAFGGENAKGSVFRDAISELPKTEKDKISGEVEKKLTTIYGKQPGQQMEAPQDGKFLVDFWKSFSETK